MLLVIKLFWTSFLFFTGVSFGYFMIAPLAINFLINYTISPDVVNQIKLSSYISNVVLIGLSTGIIFELPLLIGISRKSMIYKLLDITPDESLSATSALNLIALQKGAGILRVHDVKEAVQLIKINEKMTGNDIS